MPAIALAGTLSTPTTRASRPGDRWIVFMRHDAQWAAGPREAGTYADLTTRARFLTRDTFEEAIALADDATHPLPLLEPTA